MKGVTARRQDYYTIELSLNKGKDWVKTNMKHCFFKQRHRL
uniref:Uncharacterized protein n=1 Tax=Anguilla anguilla TaxID=7936 RepID=A0A0E9P5J3_ANGAN